MRRKERDDALLNGALIALGALATIDNIVGHGMLELDRVIPREQAFNVEVALVAFGIVMLVMECGASYDRGQHCASSNGSSVKRHAKVATERQRKSPFRAIDVPVLRHRKSPPSLMSGHRAACLAGPETSPERARASFIRKDSPSVTTMTAWWSNRSSSDAAVEGCGRKRPHWSKGQWLATSSTNVSATTGDTSGMSDW